MRAPDETFHPEAPQLFGHFAERRPSPPLLTRIRRRLRRLVRR